MSQATAANRWPHALVDQVNIPFPSLNGLERAQYTDAYVEGRRTALLASLKAARATDRMHVNSLVRGRK